VPSGLYTFPFRGLARDCRRRDADGFPDFDTISFTGFPVATPHRSQLLYRLSYALSPGICRRMETQNATWRTCVLRARPYVCRQVASIAWSRGARRSGIEARMHDRANPIEHAVLAKACGACVPNGSAYISGPRDRHPAIDQHGGAGHEARCVGGEEERSSRDLLGFGETLEGMQTLDIAAGFGAASGALA
jgi:hypothetical protein